jgi:thioredoxin reductase
MFSPWEFNIDPESRSLLEAHGWIAPHADLYPTGQDLVEQYLEPLAALPELRTRVELSTRVLGISRLGLSRSNTNGREQAPFVLRVAQVGKERDILARAVIDASGTWTTPNPIGGNGLPALGEAALRDRIFYGIPDVLGEDRARYAGKRVLVVGSGHSAFNALLDLIELAQRVPATRVIWAVRRDGIGKLFGGGAKDQLPERGRLGQRLREMLALGALTLETGFRLTRLTDTGAGIVASDGGRELGPVDEIIGATGFRPDLELTRELRLALDEVIESPAVLAPLIDPNLHSCGSVPPHGAEELKHPEQDFFVVGMKSYGRAPTFLLRTGYEQVRSVVAALMGDWESARRVELVLPETGVCSRSLEPEDDGTAVCCGTVRSSEDVTHVSVGAEGSAGGGEAAFTQRTDDPGRRAAAEPGCCDSPEGRARCCATAAPGTCCTDSTDPGAVPAVEAQPVASCCGTDRSRKDSSTQASISATTPLVTLGVRRANPAHPESSGACCGG